jgi:23S rRNA (cytidine1920-2'-O)/16S rRNA (cytidine1409-2'-O)-methyltransferase
LVRRGLVDSRVEAREAIEAGLVTVDGAPAWKPARQVAAAEAVVLAAPPRAHVSRGGEKLAHALETFAVDVQRRHCLDAGASTGGFTDCLLQHGAAGVVAVDVGYGQLHDRLRRDDRVRVMERTNVRDLDVAGLGGPRPDLVVADLSFISLAGVLPVLREVAAPEAEALVLVKPQFEAGRGQVGKGGVVRDPVVWRECLARVADAGAAVGWRLRGATASPLLGPAGNVEFLLHLTPGDVPEAPVDGLLDHAVEEGRSRRAGREGAAQGRDTDDDPRGGTDTSAPDDQQSHDEGAAR